MKSSWLSKDSITWQLICTHFQIILPLNLLIVEAKRELEPSVLCAQTHPNWYIWDHVLETKVPTEVKNKGRANNGQRQAWHF